MKKSQTVIASYILSSVLSFSFGAHAQVPLQHDGHDGVWLPSDTATRVLQDVEALRKLRPVVALYEQKATLSEQRIRQCRKAVDLSTEASDVAAEVLQTAVRSRRHAEEERDGWFAGKPVIWAVIGGVVGSVAAALATAHAL